MQTPAQPQTPRNLSHGALLRAANAAEMAANAQTNEEEMRAVYAVLQNMEAIQIGLIQADMNRFSHAPKAQERLPLRVDGDDFGVVEYRIPKKLAFHLMQQNNFGWEGLTSDEGLRDLAKTHPICKVKTVSGKIQVGYGSGKPLRTGRVQFGRGTMEFAK